MSDNKAEVVTYDEVKEGDKVTATFDDGTSITGIVRETHGYSSHEKVIGTRGFFFGSKYQLAVKIERRTPDWYEALVVKVDDRFFGRSNNWEHPWHELGGNRSLVWHTNDEIASFGLVTIVLDKNGKAVR